MANNHLVIPSTTRNGQRIQQLVDELGQAVYDAKRLADIIASYGGDYTTMAADFGFTGTNAVAQCTAAVTLLAGVYNNTILLSAAMTNLVANLG